MSGKGLDGGHGYATWSFFISTIIYYWD